MEMRFYTYYISYDIVYLVYRTNPFHKCMNPSIWYILKSTDFYKFLFNAKQWIIEFTIRKLKSCLFCFNWPWKLAWSTWSTCTFMQRTISHFYIGYNTFKYIYAATSLTAQVQNYTQYFNIQTCVYIYDSAAIQNNNKFYNKLLTHWHVRLSA